MLRLIVFIIALCVGSVKAETIYSIASGSWEDTAVWSITRAGIACGRAPGNGDEVIIVSKHAITIKSDLILGENYPFALTVEEDAIINMTGKSILVKNGGALALRGSILNSLDIEIKRGGDVHVAAGAKWDVNGNFVNQKFSSSTVVNGLINVAGSVIADSASVISGEAGVLNVFGSIISKDNATVFGSTQDCVDSKTHCMATRTLGVGYVPIELVSFSAEKVSNKIFVSWSTASEINNDYFEIERSPDGISFEPIIKILGSGTSSKLNKYYDFDLEPLHGLSYYRIREVSLDGKSKHYPAIKMEFDSETGSTATINKPTPIDETEQNLKVELSDFGLESNVLVVLKNESGKEEYTMVTLIDIEGDTYTAEDKEKRVGPGLYTIVATSSNHIYNHKIIIK